jgi:hypothetical protein
MRRFVLLCWAVLGLGAAQAGGVDDLVRVYDWVRHGLCIARITCALPADVLVPTRFADYRPHLEQGQEILLMVPPGRITWTYDLLARRFQGDRSLWPRLRILVDQKDREALAGWETPALRSHVRIVSGSAQGGDALSALTGSGLWLAHIRGANLDRLYLVVGNDLWLEPHGPVAAQLRPLVLLAIQHIEQIAQREQEVQ